MKQILIAGAGCVVTLVLLSGCSTQDSKTAETTTPGATSAPGATDTAAAATPGAPAEGNHVKFGDTDAGPVTAVNCQSDGSVMTITAEGSQQTTVVLTDEDTPSVKSVSIGQAGSEGPSLMFLEGVSATPQAARDGKRFTVNGTGLGAQPADPATPVDMPFEIAVSCP